MTIASLRTLAVLEAATEADTVFGGKTRTWVQTAALWVDLRPFGHRESGGSAARPTLIENAEAEARHMPSARAGNQLKAGGQPWRVVAVVPSRPKPGRMILKLERQWP